LALSAKGAIANSLFPPRAGRRPARWLLREVCRASHLDRLGHVSLWRTPGYCPRALGAPHCQPCSHCSVSLRQARM